MTTKMTPELRDKCLKALNELSVSTRYYVRGDSANYTRGQFNFAWTGNFMGYAWNMDLDQIEITIQGCPKCGDREYVISLAAFVEGDMVSECENCGTLLKAAENPLSDYDKALARMTESPQLAPYLDLFMYDWEREAEHLKWVATAPIEELLDWAKTTRQETQDINQD